MRTERRTKRDAMLAVGQLIERFGARLILECCADYCRRYLGLDPWASRYEAAAQELSTSPKKRRSA